MEKLLKSDQNGDLSLDVRTVVSTCITTLCFPPFTGRADDLQDGEGKELQNQNSCEHTVIDSLYR